MAMIHAVLVHLKRLDQTVPVAQALSMRHFQDGIEKRHYETVGAALVWALEMGLGESFTPEMRAAWTEVSHLLAEEVLTKMRVYP